MVNNNYEYKFGNIPSTITGLALGNIGISILWLILGINFSYINETRYILYIHAILSLFMLLIHLISVIIDPNSFKLKEIISSPASKSVVASIYTIILSLIGKLIINFEIINLPPVDLKISCIIITISAFIGLINLFFFGFKCWQQGLKPEPFFCVPVFSILFPVAVMPIYTPFYELVQKILLIVGLVLFIPIMISIVIRTFNINILRKKHSNKSILISNNPSVAIMQAGPSILCTTWMLYPLSATPNENNIIIHILFGISTIFVILTVYAMIQRCENIKNMGINSHLWASSTFPFINSAITVALYRQKYPNIFTNIYLGILTFISVINLLWINVIFIYNYFYSGRIVDSFNAIIINSDNEVKKNLYIEQQRQIP
jgi:tellurite resistance protein TehA-like permease